MNLEEYSSHDALGLAELIRRKEVTPVELANLGLRAIARLNPTLNAVIETYSNYSLAPPPAAPTSATAPFFGVPFLLKDIGSHDAGVTHELGSRLAKGLVAPPFASELVRRFRSAGVTVLGRTNIPELGSSCTTEPYLYGPTRNPWNLERSPGGSSGGAAAAVASGMVPIAHANDAGGSIRWPASCCALFGLKPSRNLNPHGPDAALAVNGLAAEHIVSRSVRDSAAMLDVTAGPDAGAWCFTPRLQGSYLEESKRAPGRLRIALNLVPNCPPGAKLHDEVVLAAQATARLCESLGHHAEEATLDFDNETAMEALSIIWSTGLRAALEALSAATQRPVSTETVEPHILAAWRYSENISAARLQWALEQMNGVARAYGRLFEKYDVMLTPAGAMEPFELGRIGKIAADDFFQWFVGMCSHAPLLSSVNIAGVPAMSVPLGWSRSGLPIGSHFVASMGQELLLLRLATQLEAAQPWAQRRPPHHVANTA